MCEIFEFFFLIENQTDPLKKSAKLLFTQNKISSKPKV